MNSSAYHVIMPKDNLNTARNKGVNHTAYLSSVIWNILKTCSLRMPLALAGVRVASNMRWTTMQQKPKQKKHHQKSKRNHRKSQVQSYPETTLRDWWNECRLDPSLCAFQPLLGRTPRFLALANHYGLNEQNMGKHAKNKQTHGKTKGIQRNHDGLVPYCSFLAKCESPITLRPTRRRARWLLWMAGLVILSTHATCNTAPAGLWRSATAFLTMHLFTQLNYSKVPEQRLSSWKGVKASQ